ncbi:imidazole glycerol phosphate synthase subunit HisH [Chloroflexota bacterium]
MIAIIDYGAGNLRSVAQAIARVGYQASFTTMPEDIMNAEAVILPGVGAAGTMMASLKKLNLVAPIQQVIANDRPFFGVCLGLQVLLSATEEGGLQKCLDIIPGTARKLPTTLKVPHMGWNQVQQRMQHPIFEGIPNNANFYFVHSYYAVPEDSSIVAAKTEYGVRFCSMILRGNLMATQFHPEKSGEPGLRIYRNFLKTCLEK